MTDELQPEDQSDAEWLRSFDVDASTIEVRLLDWAGASTPVEVWEASLDMPPTETYAFETIGRLTEALRSEERGTADFSVRESRTYTSWGASGAGQSIVLDVVSWIAQAAAAGVVGATVYDVFKSTFLDVLREARAQTGWPTTPVTRDEALRRARWHVIQRFELEVDEDHERPSLEVVGELQVPDGTWIIQLQDGDRKYEVEILGEDGLATLGRIGWSKRD